MCKPFHKKGYVPTYKPFHDDGEGLLSYCILAQPIDKQPQKGLTPVVLQFVSKQLVGETTFFLHFQNSTQKVNHG